MALAESKPIDKKNILLIGGGLVILVLLYFFSNSSVSCIERVLEEDQELSGRGAVKIYSGMRKIDYSSCPEDFRLAWIKHVQAWGAAANISPQEEQIDREYEKNLKKNNGDEMAALASTMGENPFAVLALLGDASSDLIESTWKELELIAAKHGARLPD